MKDEGEMIVGVTGGFEHFDPDLTDLENIALSRGVGEHNLIRRVWTVQNPGAGHFGQYRRSRDEILIPVRFENMRDLQPFGAGSLDIYLAVAARIDDRCLALRTDQIGKVRKAGGLYLLEQHILPRCWNVSVSPHRSSRSRVRP